jgi:hypothetical protein
VYEDGIHVGQSFLASSLFVPAVHRWSESREERGFPIGEFKCAPVFLRPRLLDLHFVDRLLVSALANDWDGEPFNTARSFDAIAVMPVPFNILGTVENLVFIASAN